MTNHLFYVDVFLQITMSNKTQRLVVGDRTLQQLLIDILICTEKSTSEKGWISERMEYLHKASWRIWDETNLYNIQQSKKKKIK